MQIHYPVDPPPADVGPRSLSDPCEGNDAPVHDRVRRRRGTSIQVAMLDRMTVNFEPPDVESLRATPVLSPISPPSNELRSSPKLWPLAKEEVIAAVAHALALRMSANREAALPSALSIFDESHMDGPAFGGSEAEVRELLEKMVKVGLEPNVRPRARQLPFLQAQRDARRHPGPSRAAPVCSPPADPLAHPLPRPPASRRASTRRPLS
jgi:hypothetical protein